MNSIRAVIDRLKGAGILGQVSRFALTGFLATLIDHSIFLGLTHWGSMDATRSHAISYPIGVLVNFFMQRYFVFTLSRSAYRAFSLSMLASVGGWALSTCLVWVLSSIAWLSIYPYPIKLIVTGIVFFYNFVTKRLVFEKKWKL